MRQGGPQPHIGGVHTQVEGSQQPIGGTIFNFKPNPQNKMINNRLIERFNQVYFRFIIELGGTNSKPNVGNLNTVNKLLSEEL